MEAESSGSFSLVTPAFMKKMLEDEIYADITFKLTAGGSVKAHRCILAGSSPVFDAMFRNNMKEKETSVVQLHDMTVEAFRAYLLCVYCGIDEISILIEHWWEVFGACQIYQIPFLPKCAIFMQKTLSISNCWNYLEMATERTSGAGGVQTDAYCNKLLQTEAGPLQDLCLKFIEFNFIRILKSKNFEDRVYGQHVLVVEVLLHFMGRLPGAKRCRCSLEKSQLIRTATDSS